MVHCSSVHAYQLYGTSAVDEASARALPSQAAYDRSKAAGEAALREEIAQGFGPWDFSPSRLGRVLCDLYLCRLPALVDGGFDWCDVRDAVRSLLAAETRGIRDTYAWFFAHGMLEAPAGEAAAA